MTQPARGRIVMLVDNDVTRDSRVQKEARSAAERGWDVILLGEKRGAGPTRWMLDGAQVRLIDVKRPLRHRRHLLRRGQLRAPLSYSRPAVAAYRTQLMWARKADARARHAASAHGGAGSSQLREARYFVARARLALLRRWIGKRAASTQALEKRRIETRSRLDRFTTAFWQKTMGVRAWRRLDPSLWDWEIAFGPVIDKLKPDIIHANDFVMLGVGARAMLRARESGRPAKLVWDAHEYLPGLGRPVVNARWHPAQVAHEREYVPFVDAVTTVSEMLADMLVAEHGLSERPAVVPNAPYVQPPPSTEEIPTVRDVAGLAPDVPIMVYSGVVAQQRGVDIVIEALPQLAGVHALLVSSSDATPYVRSLLARAQQLGVADRLHVLPYADPQHVVHYVSSADVGVHPTLHYPNHEISLATKFYEYSHARLPIVVSDVKTMAAKVRETGQGEVFIAGDVADFVRAVSAVLADPAKYRAAYDKPGLLDGWTWESSADTLEAVYRRLHPGSSV